MEIKEIVKKHLIKNGYDGLYLCGECGCKLDDLMPCGSASSSECMAGYLQLPSPTGYDYDFYIGAKKPIKTGETLRDEGIQRSLSHADDIKKEWPVRAFNLLLKYPHKFFTNEELRFYAYSMGLPHPPDERAWGGVIKKAQYAGIIKFHDHDKSKNPLAHKGHVNQWERCDSKMSRYIACS